MPTPRVLESATRVHVGRFRPAQNLAEHLPQGVDADILVLGCGDVRDILYTSSVEQGLPEPRNVLFLTLVLDDDDDVSLEQLWNIYYHFYLDEPDLLILCNQAQKLLSLSQSLQAWHASPYGATLRFCDETTLSLVHSIWAKYADAARFSKPWDKQHWEPFEDNLRAARLRKHCTVRASKQDVARSCGPLATQLADKLLFAANQHWERGLAGSVALPDLRKKETPEIPNPVFAIPLMIPSASLKYPTDPLLSFHLAAAHAKLTELSPLRLEEEEHSHLDSQDRLLQMALMQFDDWTDAFINAAPRTVVRFTASEAFAFCYTLRYNLQTGATCAQWYRGKLGFDVLQLAESEYGPGGKAPKQFDVVDTSTLPDDAGVLNWLVSAGPMLKDAPSSTLYTENPHNMSLSSVFEDELVYTTTTFSSLLGLVPAEHWTNASATSRFDEVWTAWSDRKAPVEAKTVCIAFRNAWKLNKYMVGEQPNTANLHTKFDDVLDFASKVFTSLFGIHEREGPARRQDLKHLIAQTPPWLQHTEDTMAALVNAMGDEARLNLTELRERYVGRLVSAQLGMRATCHISAFIHESSPDLPLGLLDSWVSRVDKRQPAFRNWSQRPRTVAVTVVIPREHWAAVKPLSRGGGDYREWCSALMSGHIRYFGKKDDNGGDMAATFSDVQICFGAVKTEGARDRDDFTVSVEEDKDGWNGTSPMVISFYVPTELVDAMYNEACVGMGLLRTTRNSQGWEEELEESVVVSEVECFDENRVFLSKYRPGQTGYAVTEGILRDLQRKSETSAERNAAASPMFTANYHMEWLKIDTITGRLDITSAQGKQLLADKVPIVRRQSSPYTIDIVFGKKTLVLPLSFPLPVLADGAKLRVARKSAYIEVVAPIAQPSTSPEVLEDYMLPTALLQPSGIPATLNIPHLNLDRLPILALDDKSRTRFLTTLTSLTFSSRERRLRARTTGNNNKNSSNNNNGLSSSARLNFKESLFTIFMLASGLQGGQTGLFALTHPQRGGVHMLLFASAVRLDGAHGSVVLDAAVLPLTKDLVAGGELAEFLLLLRALECCSLTVDDAELRLWKRALPALAERCRTWRHDEATCEYVRAGKAPVSLDDGARVLCSCGEGKLPADFMPLPEWETVAKKYATRVAISPVYASVLVEELIDPALARAVATGEALGDGSGDVMKACRNCGKTEEQDGVRLKRCLRCLEVAYCSNVCQKLDWKKHRMECEEAEVYVHGNK
ncbi:uncharacterized protein THITE_52613 [Thermothielavioides terrestris NRRL 8126]|uniref:MYND-type domain-containing protein n=1 Tax=Thermothielavioides terrestris (strain ATCC 38088 / NRRL 8126) TaxID=578455 RepID=G2R8Q3_THETT|nr:uncharacterized protein THITE_52613 [Thermothielavioides terrestris NRRL 8126]AEO68269.1 hypothetical protein THITE_52613 [Thermothielavioides terrestris NRRL 8126]